MWGTVRTNAGGEKREKKGKGGDEGGPTFWGKGMPSREQKKGKEGSG